MIYLIIGSLLACGDKEQAEDSAVEEPQQEESQDTSNQEPEDTSSEES